MPKKTKKGKKKTEMQAHIKEETPFTGTLGSEGYLWASQPNGDGVEEDPFRGYVMDGTFDPMALGGGYVPETESHFSNAMGEGFGGVDGALL